MRTGRLTTGVLLWLAAAAAATAVGMTAVAAIGTDIFGAGNPPLSEAEVERLLASQSRRPTTAPSQPPATSDPPAGEAPRPTEIPTTGGTVYALCEAGGVRVVNSIPAQGYQVETDDDGGEVDDHPSVTFTSGETEVEVRLRCVNGVLAAPEIRYDDD